MLPRKLSGKKLFIYLLFIPIHVLLLSDLFEKQIKYVELLKLLNLK